MLLVVTVSISSRDREVGYFGTKFQLVRHVSAAEFNLIVYICRCYLAEVIYLNLLITLSHAFLDM